MKELFNQYIQNLETYIMFRIKEEVERLTPELEIKGRSPISLAMGAPTSNPPIFVIDKLKSVLDERGIHTYSVPKGELYFRKAVSERMKMKYNVDVTPDEIISLIGSKEGLANMVRALINPVPDEKEKDIILIPDPGYASYSQMVITSGGYPYSVPLTIENRYRPDLDECMDNLKKDGFNPKKVKALIINYPNNPLGVAADRNYYKHVVDFCKRNQILLISDAAYIDIYFGNEERPMSILEIEGAKDVAVEFFSFSKPYSMTGWRLGWVCGNKEAVSMFGKLKSTIDSGLFKALQKASAELLNSIEGDRYIIEENNKFRQKRNEFVNGLKGLGWPDFHVPDSTFYVWAPIPPRFKTSQEFTSYVLNKSGIVLVPGNAFGKNGEGFFRASVVCSENDLYTCIERLRQDGIFYNV